MFKAFQLEHVKPKLYRLCVIFLLQLPEDVQSADEQERSH